MGKSTSVKREIRFQQWIQQVKEYNERPDGMSMSAWCKTRELRSLHLQHAYKGSGQMPGIMSDIS